MDSRGLSGFSWGLLLYTEKAGCHVSGLSIEIGVLFPRGILCGFFSLDVSPALNTTISLYVNFVLMMVCVKEMHLVIRRVTTV